MHTLEILRRRRPDVCSTCGWNMIDFSLRQWACVNQRCPVFMDGADADGPPGSAGPALRADREPAS